MSWRKNLFKVGERYRVKKEIQLPPWPLVKGQILRFVKDYYSHYDEVSAYEFIDEATGEIKYWQLPDDRPETDSIEVFEEIHEPNAID